MKIDVNDERAIARTKPTGAVLAVAGSLEGKRRWLDDLSGLRFEPTGRNLDLFRDAFPDVEIERSLPPTELVTEFVDEFSGGTVHYQSKTPPYAHQKRASEKLRTSPTIALFMEQGTGKTKVAIDRAGELFCEGRIDAVLVVAKKGVHRQWIESEVPTHLGIDWDGVAWPFGMLPQSLLERDGKLKFFSINFDGAKTPRGEAACSEFVEAFSGRVLIVADETQEIKNAKSARWKALDRITKRSRSPYRLALTGTPISKDLSDEWSQLKWLNEDILGIRYITAFRNEYCIMGGFEGRVVVGQKNLDRFRAKVDPFTFRATKDEIGILPKAYRRWEFDLSTIQKTAIREIRRTREAQIDTGEIVSAANAAVALSKVQQASNGFLIDEDKKVHPLFSAWVSNPRLLALKEILDAYEGPTIVWAKYREDMRTIEEMLADIGETVVTYHGGTPDKERAENVRRFLSGEARIFLSNPQAGGTGLNLQTGGCSHAIYYSNSYNAIDRWQSEDRIHRIGTKGAVVYTDLVARGSIDKAILSNLSRKKGISDLALGDIRKILGEIG